MELCTYKTIDTSLSCWIGRGLPCLSLPRAVNGNDDARRQLAVIILRHVDRGEHAPIRLSEIVYRELAGLDQSMPQIAVRLASVTAFQAGCGKTHYEEAKMAPMAKQEKVERHEIRSRQKTAPTDRPKNETTGSPKRPTG
jgi:hypothetical protein